MQKYVRARVCVQVDILKESKEKEKKRTYSQGIIMEPVINKHHSFLIILSLLNSTRKKKRKGEKKLNHAT